MVRVTLKLNYPAVHDSGEYPTLLFTYPAGGRYPLFIDKLVFSGGHCQSKIYLLSATVATVAPDALTNCLLVSFGLFTALSSSHFIPASSSGSNLTLRINVFTFIISNKRGLI